MKGAYVNDVIGRLSALETAGDLNNETIRLNYWFSRQAGDERQRVECSEHWCVVERKISVV